MSVTLCKAEWRVVFGKVLEWNEISSGEGKREQRSLEMRGERTDISGGEGERGQTFVEVGGWDRDLWR